MSNVLHLLASITWYGFRSYLVQESVDGRLVLDIDVLLDERGRNGVVNVGDSLSHT